MSTINVRSYKGPVRPDGTPIELPQKVLKLTKKSNMRHKKPNRSRVGDFLVGLLLFLVACAMAFPLVFAISSSLKPLDELFRFPPTLFPRHPTIDNFSDLLVTMGQSWVPFSRYITNTVVITLVGTLASADCVPRGVCAGEVRFPARQAVFRPRRDGADVQRLRHRDTELPDHDAPEPCRYALGGHPARVRRADWAVPDEAVHGRAAHVAD